jgi:hypothetical protein
MYSFNAIAAHIAEKSPENFVDGGTDRQTDGYKTYSPLRLHRLKISCKEIWLSLIWIIWASSRGSYLLHSLILCFLLDLRDRCLILYHIMVQASQFFNIQQRTTMKIRNPKHSSKSRKSELPDYFMYQYSLGPFFQRRILLRTMVLHLHVYLHVQCIRDLAFEY